MFKALLQKQITYKTDRSAPRARYDSPAGREALLMFCYDFQVGTSTNTEKQPWRPSAANQSELNSRLRAQRKRRRLSSIIFLLLLIPFVAYEFTRTSRDPELQTHFALAVAMGVLIVLGVLLLVGLLFRRSSKRKDDKSILRL